MERESVVVPKRRRIAAICGDGHIRLVEQEVPELKQGHLSVEVHASLISPGTELGGWRALKARQGESKKEAVPRPFGYANAGIVRGVGEGCKGFDVGDRVACMGGGVALHTDWAVVPYHLCVKLLDKVSFAQGAYGHLAATAMQAVRRGAPELGEFTAVVGLGIVGLLTARLYQVAGSYVIGWDTIPFRIELAKRWGIDEAVMVGNDKEVAATNRFTGGRGLDTGVLAFGGDANRAFQALTKCMKTAPDGHKMGRIVVVGGARFEYPADTTNLDVRRSSRTGAGYHDAAWETGPDYPDGFMRWTTKTNLELCMRLMAEGKLPVDMLTTHTVRLKRVEQEMAGLLEEPDRVLGVVFEMR